MKKLITLLVALTSFIGFAQSKNIVLEDNYNYNSQVKITSLSYDVDSVTELEEIDWKEIKSIFNTNNEDDVIKLSFAINMKKQKNKKVKIAGKFSVEGKTDNIEELIKKSKKGVNGLIKVYNKYQNK
jgi:hypothetical protein